MLIHFLEAILVTFNFRSKKSSYFKAEATNPIQISIKVKHFSPLIKKKIKIFTNFSLISSSPSNYHFYYQLIFFFLASWRFTSYFSDYLNQSPYPPLSKALTVQRQHFLFAHQLTQHVMEFLLIWWWSAYVCECASKQKGTLNNNFYIK